MKYTETLRENIDLLIQMLKDKKSYTVIAKTFNVTKNSLAGFIHRNLKDNKPFANKPKPKIKKPSVKVSSVLLKPNVCGKKPSVNQCKFLHGDNVPYGECYNVIEKGSYCQEHYDLCYVKRNNKN